MLIRTQTLVMPADGPTLIETMIWTTPEGQYCYEVNQILASGVAHSIASGQFEQKAAEAVVSQPAHGPQRPANGKAKLESVGGGQAAGTRNGSPDGGGAA